MIPTNTRVTAQQIRRQHWTQIVQERHESGLSVREYCQTHGIREKQYYYWQHKLRVEYATQMVEEHAATVTDTTPVLVPLAQPIGPGDPIRLTIGNCTLEVTETTSQTVLLKTLQVLQQMQD